MTGETCEQSAVRRSTQTLEVLRKFLANNTTRELISIGEVRDVFLDASNILSGLDDATQARKAEQAEAANAIVQQEPAPFPDVQSFV